MIDVPRQIIWRSPLSPGTIVSVDLDPREVVDPCPSVGHRVVHLVYPPSRVVASIKSAFDADLHNMTPFKRGEIAVGVETRTFEIEGLHDKLSNARSCPSCRVTFLPSIGLR